jgi:PAS domain S-box-containing protein
MKEHATTPSEDLPDTLVGEESFRLLVDSITDFAIFMLDPGGHVVSWNPGAERIKGFTRDEIVGRHFSCLYPAEAVQRGVPDRELRDAAREGRFAGEGWRVRKDGAQFWASVIIAALRDERGALCGFSKVTRDLTELVLAEETLQQQTVELATRNEELLRFNRAAVGREARMIELKQEVNELRRQLGLPAAYPLTFLETPPQTPVGAAPAERREQGRVA